MRLISAIAEAGVDMLHHPDANMGTMILGMQIRRHRVDT